jgi:pyruvate dehydrogenase E2 component (dihydrolipoamide acetyltransferase)
MHDYPMPSLGADMEGATLVEWHFKAGDKVRRGDLIATVETVKGTIDIEVFEDAIIDAILVEPGTYVPVGGAMARLRAEGEAPAASSAPSTPAAVSAPRAAAPVTPPPPAAEPPAARRTMASPAAKRRAQELGVELATLRGTGPDGAISLEDVEKTAVARHPPELDAKAAMRQAIASAMAKSKREIPHYYLSQTVDLGRAMGWLAEQNEKRSVTERLLPAALLLKATALAVREVPEINGTYVDGSFRPSERVHLGVAISLRQGGLVAPALQDADTLPLGVLMAKLMDLVTRARKGGLKGSELSEPTLTVTNLGDLGVELVLPVISPPQVAIVGFGKVAERPWAHEGRLALRPTVTASLAADHRVSDGHRGGLFLAALDKLLQEPERL